VIDLSRISKQFGGEYLFRDLSLRIGDGERLAVVGANGAGKSTLMKIILGEVEPDGGEISRSRSHSAGYLPQDGIVHAGRTVADEAATAFDDLLELHGRAGDIHREIDALAAAGGESSPELQTLVEELGKIQHHLEHREGWSIEAKVKEILLGLGFRHRDLERSTDQFSGGWQMRLALAKLLLREPAILMLDEPTNHLDIESLQWVEEYLGGYEGSVVLISHDRRFLDNLAERTVELSLGRLAEYRGNYSYFLKEKEDRAAIQRARFANQQDKIKSTMQFVERFRAKNTKASQVQSRLRMLEKMEVVEVENSESGIAFDFPPPPKPGKVIAELSGIAKAYNDEEVFSGLDLTILRGDRVAFLGVNGAGKSTLARILAGVEDFQSGTRTIGHNVSISYFTQHQAESLDPSKTALQTLEDAAQAGMQGRLRTLLGCFLFRGDDVFKPVGILSGGEKSRLALAKMLLTPSNFLILDEPTNHLDLRSKEVLRNALIRFTGASVLVSHDRDFLEPLVSKIVEFHDGGTRVLPGSLGDYFDRIRREREDNAPLEEGKEREGLTPAQIEKKRKRLEAERRQKLSRTLKPLRKSLEKVEGKISLAEERKGEIESDLASDKTCRDGRRVAELSGEYKELTTELAYLYDEWARLQEKMEDGEN
jgi:ATP-binding cassette subfamily F protein 3